VTSNLDFKDMILFSVK